jgi:hypothetical protein
MKKHKVVCGACCSSKDILFRKGLAERSLIFEGEIIEGQGLNYGMLTALLD